jgi:hypothetical protein
MVLCLSFALFACSSIAADDQVQALLDRAIQAMGGAKNLQKFTAASWKTTEKAYGPEGVATIVAECARRGSEQFRRDSEFALDDVRVRTSFVINGTEGWVRTRSGEVVAIADEADLAETKTNSLYLSWITTLVPLKGKEFKLSTGGELKVADRLASCVLVSRDGYRDVMLCFDTETGLLVRSEMPIKVQSGSEQELGKVLIQEKLYSDFQETDGVRWAKRIDTRLDGKLRNETEILEFKPHEKMDDALFARP